MTTETEQTDGAATNEAEVTPNAEGQKPAGENTGTETEATKEGEESLLLAEQRIKLGTY